MKYKILILILLFISLLAINPIRLMANDEKEKVCFFQKNCHGELEYICLDSNEIVPQGSACLPPCRKPEE